jgi:hypothetical protein
MLYTVMTSKEILQAWLNPTLTDKEMQEIFNYKIPSEALEAWPVRSIRQRKEDNEKVIEPIQLLEQPSLF